MNMWQTHRNAVDKAAQDLFDAVQSFGKFLNHDNPNIRIVVTSSKPNDDGLTHETTTLHVWRF